VSERGADERQSRKAIARNKAERDEFLRLEREAEIRLGPRDDSGKRVEIGEGGGWFGWIVLPLMLVLGVVFASAMYSAGESLVRSALSGAAVAVPIVLAPLFVWGFLVNKFQRAQRIARARNDLCPVDGFDLATLDEQDEGFVHCPKCGGHWSRGNVMNSWPEKSPDA